MGVDVERFKTSRNNNQDHVFTVTFVGRLSSQKGVTDVLAAVRKIKSEGVHDIHFNIAGDGPQKKQLQKYVRDNQLSDIVSFLGWVQPKDLPSLLKKSDVFIGPSVIDSDGWMEAFGLVFVEAAAAGLPVIATNVGGIKDIVDDNITGFLVDQKSPDQLADKIVVLKNDEKLRIKMSKAAVTKSDMFSWDTAEVPFLYFERLPTDFDPDLFQYNLGDYVYTTFNIRNSIGLDGLFLLKDENYYVQLI